jgi:large subunit ribosomal protein L29
MTDLRGLSADELTRRAGDLEEQVFRLRIQKSMGQGEAGNKIRPLRRELARLKTVLSEKGGKS